MSIMTICQSRPTQRSFLESINHLSSFFHQAHPIPYLMQRAFPMTTALS